MHNKNPSFQTWSSLNVRLRVTLIGPRIFQNHMTSKIYLKFLEHHLQGLLRISRASQRARIIFQHDGKLYTFVKSLSVWDILIEQKSEVDYSRVDRSERGGVVPGHLDRQICWSTFGPVKSSPITPSQTFELNSRLEQGVSWYKWFLLGVMRKIM